MKLKKISVYYYFWIVGFVIVVLGIVGNIELDINIHDTYFVISNSDVTIFLSSIYFVSGLGYWIFEKLLKKTLNRTLSFLHSAILIGSFVVYWLAFFYHKVFSKSSFPLFDDSFIMNQIALKLLFLIILAFPIYVVNIFIGIFSKSSSAIR